MKNVIIGIAVVAGAALMRRLYLDASASSDCDRCGHERAAHEHYRPGTECGMCNCPALTTPPLSRYLARAL